MEYSFDRDWIPCNPQHCEYCWHLESQRLIADTDQPRDDKDDDNSIDFIYRLVRIAENLLA